MKTSQTPKSSKTNEIIVGAIIHTVAKKIVNAAIIYESTKTDFLDGTYSPVSTAFESFIIVLYLEV